MSDASGAAEVDAMAEPEPRPARSIIRRPGVPNGRAAAGALLITLAVVGLFVASRGSAEGPETSYVVVAEAVAKGSRIDAGALTTRRMDLAEDVAALAVTDMASAVDSIALENLLPGQLLQHQVLVDSADGPTGEEDVFELSFEIDRSRALAGSLRAGELVDVVATLRRSDEACSSVVASGARVVDSYAAAGNLSGDSRKLTVTLALDGPADALGAILAVDEAEATLVRNVGSEPGSLAGVVCEDAFGSDQDGPGDGP